MKLSSVSPAKQVVYLEYLLLTIKGQIARKVPLSNARDLTQAIKTVYGTIYDDIGSWHADQNIFYPDYPFDILEQIEKAIVKLGGAIQSKPVLPTSSYTLAVDDVVICVADYKPCFLKGDRVVIKYKKDSKEFYVKCRNKEPDECNSIHYIMPEEEDLDDCNLSLLFKGSKA